MSTVLNLVAVLIPFSGLVALSERTVESDLRSELKMLEDYDARFPMTPMPTRADYRQMAHTRLFRDFWSDVKSYGTFYLILAIILAAWAVSFKPLSVLLVAVGFIMLEYVPKWLAWRKVYPKEKS